MDEKIKRRQLAKQKELKKFLRKTCGKEFCQIVFLGSNHHLCCGFSSLQITTVSTDTPKRTKIHWEIKVEGRHPLPHGDAPYVLAALIKLYLTQKVFDTEFIFTKTQIIDELGLEFNDENEKLIEEVIESYFRLRYIAQAIDSRHRSHVFTEIHTTLFSEYGYYSEEVETVPSLTKIYDEVIWHTAFVEGLRERRVVLCGIDLGPLILENLVSR